MRTTRLNSITVVPSVLDRLLDDEPNVARDAPRARQFDARQLKQAVARDLEALLNTRRELLDALPAEYSEARTSIIDYGVPDFSGSGFASPDDRNAVRSQLEAAIANHERRLTQVRVTLEPVDAGDRQLRFRVDAILHVEPAREPVRFDALLQVATQQYTVRDGDGFAGSPATGRGGRE